MGLCSGPYYSPEIMRSMSLWLSLKCSLTGAHTSRDSLAGLEPAAGRKQRRQPGGDSSGQQEPGSKLFTRGLYEDYIGSLFTGLLGVRYGVLAMAHISNKTSGNNGTHVSVTIVHCISSNIASPGFRNVKFFGAILDAILFSASGYTEQLSAKSEKAAS